MLIILATDILEAKAGVRVPGQAGQNSVTLCEQKKGRDRGRKKRREGGKKRWMDRHTDSR